MKCQLYIESLVYIEMCNVCKVAVVWFYLLFAGGKGNCNVVCVHRMKTCMVGRFGSTHSSPLLQIGCSCSHPSCFITTHQTIAPPPITLWALWSWQIGPQKRSVPWPVNIFFVLTTVESLPQACGACSTVSRTTELLPLCLKAMKIKYAVCVWRNIEFLSFDHCWVSKATDLHIQSVCV